MLPQVLQVGSAYHKFGFHLFAQVTKQEVGKNVFLSPYSVATVLSMLCLGASGETRRALEQVLHLEKLEPEVIKQANREFLKTLAALGPHVDLILANSIWIRCGLEFSSGFLEQMGDSFGAEIQGLDFSDSSSVSSINEWVAKKTKGRISDIVDQLSPRLVMAVINALYFKGQWLAEFDPGSTRDRFFYLENGKQKSVPMMSHRGWYRYVENENFEAVVLPYRDNRFGLYLFVPKKGQGLDAFLEDLDEAAWEEWMQRFDLREGEVVLPKFKLEYSTELSSILTVMGMGAAFNPERADFQGIRAARDIYVGRVSHKALIEVNEEGTEAAAATGTATLGASLEPFKLVAERPFFFAIRDSQSRLVLFMGVVCDPR